MAVALPLPIGGVEVPVTRGTA